MPPAKKRVANATAPEATVASSNAVRMTATESALAAILDEAQKPFANAQQLLKQFWKLEQKTDADEFSKVLIHSINRTLVVAKREPVVERLHKFFAIALTLADESYSASEGKCTRFYHVTTPDEHYCTCIFQYILLTSSLFYPFFNVCR